MKYAVVAVAQQGLHIYTDIQSYRRGIERFFRLAETKHARLLIFPERTGLMVIPPLIEGFRTDLLKRAEANKGARLSWWQRARGGLMRGTARLLKANLPIAVQQAMEEMADFIWQHYVDTFAELAYEYKMTVVAGSGYFLDLTDRKRRHIATIFGPDGDVLGQQAQVIVPDTEQDRVEAGNGWQVFDTPVGRLGITFGEEILYPEVGRWLAYQGAEAIITLLATPEDTLVAQVRDGLWARVMDNHIFGALACTVGTDPFMEEPSPTYRGRSAIFAPHGLTPRYNGVLVEAGTATAEVLLTTRWDFAALRRYWESAPIPVRQRVPVGRVAKVLAALYEREVTLTEATRALPERGPRALPKEAAAATPPETAEETVGIEETVATAATAAMTEPPPAPAPAAEPTTLPEETEQPTAETPPVTPPEPASPEVSMPTTEAEPVGEAPAETPPTLEEAPPVAAAPAVAPDVPSEPTLTEEREEEAFPEAHEPRAEAVPSLAEEVPPAEEPPTEVPEVPSAPEPPPADMAAEPEEESPPTPTEDLTMEETTTTDAQHTTTPGPQAEEEPPETPSDTPVTEETTTDSVPTAPSAGPLVDEDTEEEDTRPPTSPTAEGPSDETPQAQSEDIPSHASPLAEPSEEEDEAAPSLSAVVARREAETPASSEASPETDTPELPESLWASVKSELERAAEVLRSLSQEDTTPPTTTTSAPAEPPATSSPPSTASSTESPGRKGWFHRLLGRESTTPPRDWDEY